MTDPNRVIGGRERGPAMGTVIFSALMVACGLVLLITRVVMSDISVLGLSQGALFVIVGCMMGWPAVQRVRRNKRREAES
ncbi:hypothetical protein [Leucobacter sp. G161]|uniref:hypothetical protein n=1 Tax=Leucobacter sp. G161 TaxID=663704 RepID=UPI00073C16B0|nr:hypothetical protein [Leucobacter sp. G161]KUF07019.1 hypothetical protein AUL38_01545 [Leucobacter sp. G161]